MRLTVAGAGLFAALLVLAVVAVGGIAADQSASEESDANASFGAEVSSFMQANDVEAQDEVDREMFNESMRRANTTEEKRALIEERAERLERRQQQLGELQANVSADGPSAPDFAIATRLDVGAAHLERSANQTDRVARGVGVNTDRLAQIESNARHLRGSEMAELARSVGGPPDHAGGGPPEDGPPAGNGSDAPGADSPGNGSEGAATGNGSGAGQGNGTDGGGPPDHAEGGGPNDNSGNADGGPNDESAAESDDTDE